MRRGRRDPGPVEFHEVPPIPPGGWPAEGLAELTHEPWERVLPFVGGILMVIVALEVAITWAFKPLLGPVMLQVVGAELFPGREAAIPLGLTGHIPELWLWQLTWTIDWAYFCFLYPIFLTILHRRHGKGGFIMRRIEKLEQVALRSKGFATKWGPWGIFAFMLIPFLVNGPLVGMVLGRIAGIKTRRLLFPVALANFVGNGIWVILYDQFFWQMRRISADLDQYVAFGVFGLLFVLAVVGLTVDEMRDRRKRRGRALP